MAIKTVSVKKLGRDYKISPHFKLKEFQCQDGSDTVLYSEELFTKLERLREFLGGDEKKVSITINSGYRTPTHNKKVGGATSSQHTKGTAADIKVKINGTYLAAKKVCAICEYLGIKGIGYINDKSTHVDMRSSGSYRGDERSGYSNNVKSFHSYFGISEKEVKSMEVKKKEYWEDSWNKAKVKGVTDGSNPDGTATRKDIMCWLDRLGLLD